LHRVGLGATLDTMNQFERQSVEPNPLEGQHVAQPEKRMSRELLEARELQHNDLIISDSGLTRAKETLKENQVPYELTKMTEKRKLGKSERGETVWEPGEFIVTISDPEDPKKPAPFEYVKKVFELLRNSDVSVRYGKNPEAEQAKSI